MGDFCSDLSVRNRRWVVRNHAGKMPQIDGVPNELLKVLGNRGIQDVQEFLRPTFAKAMPNPFVMKGMEDAVGRFCQAVENLEKIGIFGDYDVDGATSTAILTRFLRMVGITDTTFYIPQRLTEGYGPNKPAMDKLAAQGVKLLVVVDSGTTYIEVLEHAKSLGLDIIVLDHHEARSDGQLPPAHVVNPKRIDEDGSLSYLCTAGLAFLFSVGVNRRLRESGFYGRTGQEEPDLRSLLGLVALGTVCDMVPLVGLNRAYVRLGLGRMHEILGLRALQEATTTEKRGIPDFTSGNCGFVFGPCINAGGRISDTMQGSRLLTTEDPDEARMIAETLAALNEERKEMQRLTTDQALEMATTVHADDPVLVLYNPDWHPGVVGLVASKVKDMCDKPTFVIGAKGKGSARAVDGFNIGRAIMDAKEIKDAEGNSLYGISSGGGHAAAGGITINPEKLQAFREYMYEQVKGMERPPVSIDLAFEVGGLPHDLVPTMTELMSPTGMGNPEPRVALTGGICTETRRMKDIHIKAIVVSEIGKIEVIMFQGVGTAMGDALERSEGHYLDVFGKVKLNEYMGRVTLQVVPDDFIIGKLAYSKAAAE